MSATKTTCSSAGITGLLGGGLCILFAGVFWLDNVWAWAAALAVGLAATLAAARCAAGPQNKLSAGLQGLMARRREFPFKEVESWKEFGPLAAQVSEAVIYNMHRREYYRGAVQAVGSPFLLCDRDGVITHASNSLMELLRKQEKDVVGRNVGEAFYGRGHDSHTADAMRHGAHIAEEKCLTLWDGRTLDAFVYIDCIRSVSGETMGAVLCLVDLALVKEQQRRLEGQQAEMRSLGERINEVAQRVASAAEELSASADEQAQGAHRQKGQTDSVVSAMEQMASTVMNVAENATAASQASDSAGTSAKDGVSLVKGAVGVINQAAESTGKLASVLTQLDAQAGEIDRIINVINDIADQTNLLALNAAIEAARAGEAGRGFAVVADEVRKLAEKTMTATKEVENSIREVQERSRHAVSVMRDTENQVHEGAAKSSRTGEALEDILRRIEDVNQRVSQIATAAGQQARAAEDVNSSVSDIATVAAAAEEGSAQAADAARELAQLSHELLSLSSRFTGSETAPAKKAAPAKKSAPRLVRAA
ncbi:MAG: methyl-accepting chemotaxis protein [Thermodesulfobacteriota bacterium]